MTTISYTVASVASQTLTSSAGLNTLPTITATGNGLSWAAAWNQASNDFVNGTWSSSNFSPVHSANAVVNSTTTNDQFGPDMARLSNGNSVTVFSDASAGTANPVIRAIVHTPTGAEVAPDFVVGTGDNVDGNFNAAVGSVSGRFMTVWEDRDSFGLGDSDLYFSIHNNNGTAVISNQILANAGSFLETAPTVTGLAGGQFAVVWTERATVGTDTKLYGQVFSSSGVTAGPRFDVAVNLAINDQPSIVALRDGNFAVLFRENYSDGAGTTDISYAKYSPTGALLDYDRVNLGPAASNEAAPSVTQLSNGLIAVSYQTDVFADTMTAIRLLNPNNGQVLAATDVPGKQADIAGLADGHAALIRMNAAGTDPVVDLVQFARTTVGTAGNDMIASDSLRDDITGGNGIDTVLFNGARAGHTGTISGPNVLMVDSIPGRDGTDSLSGVERGRFSDGTLAFDIHLPGSGPSNAGSAYRMYEAAFNRTPDAPGLAFWTKALDAGLTVRAVAEGFVASAEFATVYGPSPGNAALVNQFYFNILDRAPEPGGFDFWLSLLNTTNDRALVLEGIANSVENQAGLLPIIGQGIFVPGDLLF
jgi:hypothetical protein